MLKLPPMPNQLIDLLLQYRYVLIVPVAVVGGPPFSILLGFIVRFSALLFLPTYLSLILGEIIGDVAWYWIGYHFGERFIRRFGKYVSITDEHVDTMKKMFSKYQTKILTISKLTTGLGFAPIVLFTAGMSRMSFRKYLEINVFWQFIWSLLLLGIGYFFGNIYIQVGNGFQQAELVVVFVILFLCAAGFAKYVRDRVIKKYSQ